MATSSFSHNIHIKTYEQAERLIEAMEKAEEYAENNAEEFPQVHTATDKKYFDNGGMK